MRYLIALSSLILLLTSCAGIQQKNPFIIEKPVYLKCQIPDIPPADLEPVDMNQDYPQKLQRILNNYFKLQFENQLLREALKLCR